MPDSTVAITPGSGALVAVYLDSLGDIHQKVVLETESASGDPAKVNSTNPLPVSIAGALTAAVTGTVAVSNLPATQPVSGTVAVSNLPATQNVALVSGAVSGVQDNTAFTPGTTVGIPIMGEVDDVATSNAGEGNIASVRMSPSRALHVATVASTNDGWQPGSYVATASTNAVDIKASAGQLGYMYISNVAASVRYLRLFDLATVPTVGTSTPVQRYALPANSVMSLNFGAGMQFLNGISFDITDGASDSDTTATAAGDVIFNYGFK